MTEILEAENAKLKKEIEKLHGRLGARGSAIAREEKYKELEHELKHMYSLCEKQLEKAESLRDMFAAKAMQGMLSNGFYWGTESDGVSPRLPLQALTQTAYEFADAMLKQRESGND